MSLSQRLLFNNKGITLAELIVVVTIIGILAGLAVTLSSGTREGYAVRGAARQLYSEMQYAKSIAVQEGKSMRIDFNGTSGEYTLGEDNNEDGAIDDVLRSGDITSSYPGLTICVATDALFRGDGSAEPVGAGAYLLSGEHNRRVYIRSAGTGNIKISDDSCP